MVIGNSVTKIGVRAFYGCSGLTSVEIPNSVTSIGNYAFNYCSGLTSVVIPNSVTEIGWGAFQACSGLTSVEIPNSVTKIGEDAFKGCNSVSKYVCDNEMAVSLFSSQVEELIIGEHVTAIADKAITSSNLSLVKVAWQTPAGLNILAYAFTHAFQSTLFVPIGCIKNYETRSPWNNFKEIKEYVPGSNEGAEKCASPRIGVDGKTLTFYSTTPGAKYYYTIDCPDAAPLTSSDNGQIELSATYTINVYAYADGYDNSETVTATLVWVSPTVSGDNVMSMEAEKAVLIRTEGGRIILDGTEQGESIQLYTLDGRHLSSAIAADGFTSLPVTLPFGEVVIIRYGGKAVKVALR